ncbi:porin [bacterium]|nr:porin [bacterium]
MKKEKKMEGRLKFAEDASIGGIYDIQYRSGDSYKATGGDKFDVSALYLTVMKNLDKNIDSKLIIDGADLASETATQPSHKYVEEAQIIIRNIAELPLTVVFGKDEMPFGQDYDKSLFDSLIHSLEIDKVWGLNAGYKFNDMFKLEAAVWEQAGNTDIGISENYTTRLSLSPMDKLAVEISFANIEQLAAKDESRVSAGVVYNLPAIVLYGEYVGLDNPVTTLEGYALGENPTLSCIGVDVPITAVWKIKARYESVDDDSNADTISGVFQTGVDYVIGKNTTLMIEYQNILGEGSVQDVRDISVGIIATF